MSRSVFFRYAIAAVILLGGLYRLYNVRTVVTYTPDERGYAQMAREASNRGSEALRQQSRLFLKDVNQFEWPSPARSGFVYLAVGPMTLSGIQDPGLVEALSAIFSIVSMLLIAQIGLQFLDERHALIAVLLFAVSPPVLAIARRGWQESFVTMHFLLMLYCGLYAIRTGKALWAILLGVVCAYALGVKENDMLVAGVVGSLCAVTMAIRKMWKPLSYFLASLAVSLSIVAMWIGSLIGGVRYIPYFNMQVQKFVERSTYAIQMESGSAATWFEMLVRTDIILFLCFLIGLVALGFSLRKRRVVLPLIWSAAITAVFLLLPLATSHTLNLRFAAAAFPAMCLIAAGGICWFWERFLTRMLNLGDTGRIVLVTCCLIAVAVYSTNRFSAMFEKTDLQDLTAGHIMWAVTK